MNRRIEGGCHCGKIRFRMTLHHMEAIECNCSICTKKGTLHLIVAPSDFELLQGADAMTTYTFGTHTAKHHFCATCGVSPFYRPRSHPDHFDVNARCLDDVDLDAFSRVSFNGQEWEQNIDRIR